MDPVLGTVIVSIVAAVGSIMTAIVAGRNSAERLADKDRIRRLERRLIDKHGETADDVKDL